MEPNSQFLEYVNNKPIKNSITGYWNGSDVMDYRSLHTSVWYVSNNIQIKIQVLEAYEHTRTHESNKIREITVTKKWFYNLFTKHIDVPVSSISKEDGKYIIDRVMNSNLCTGVMKGVDLDSYLK